MSRQREFTEKIRRLHGRRAAAPRALVDTFGCQQNVADSQRIMGMLEAMGCTFTDKAEEADIVVLNTCAIRDHAEQRVYGNLGALTHTKKANPEQIICLCGCMAQRPEVAERVRQSYRHVDLVFGPQALWRFPELLHQVYSRRRRVFSVADEPGQIAEGIPVVREGSIRAWVSIMYGCDNFCSYCIVPYVRGRERSRELLEVVAEVRSLAEQGITEITLLGQNVNSYGKGMGVDFADLLKAVNGVDGIRRIRYMSSHPKDLTPRLMTAIAENDKVCHHMHLPVQSGSTAILERMNRRYTRDGYLKLVEDLRRTVPDIELTTDVIVGFPGETDRDFEDTLSLMDQVGYAAAFTFKYSPRKGTRAAEAEDQIPEQVKKERLKRLNDLQARKTAENNRKYLGHRGEVLIEGFDKREQTVLFGKLDTFKMVYFPGDEKLLGTYQTVKVTECARNSLLGRME